MTLQAPVETPRRGLFRSGVLIDCHLSYWRGKKALKAGDLNMEPEDVPEIFQLGSKELIDPNVIKRFTEVESKIKYALHRWTFRFPIGGARFTPYSALPKIAERLKLCEDEFWAIVDEFLTNFAQYRDAQLAKYPTLADKLEGEYPSNEHLRSRFRFSQYVYTVQEVKPTSLAEVMAVGQGALKTAEDYQARYKEDLERFVGESIGELRSQVAAMALSVQEKLEKGENFTERNFGAVRNAIQQFRALNFADDRAVSDELTRLEATLGPQVNEERGRGDFLAAIQGVAKKAVAATDITEIVGEYKRKIDWEGD